MTMTSSRRIVPILPGDRTRMSMPLVGMWTVNRSLLWKVCTHFIHFRDNNMKRASSQECPGSFLVGVFDRTKGFVLYECSGIAKKKDEVSHYDWTGLLQLDEIHQQSHEVKCSFRVVVDSAQIERFVDVACEFVEPKTNEVVVVSDDDDDDDDDDGRRSLEIKEEEKEEERVVEKEKEDTKETNALKVMIDESQDEEEKFKVSEQKEEQTVTPTSSTTTIITCDIDRLERVRRALEKVSEKIESLKNVPTMICSNAHSWRSSFVDSNREQEEKNVEKNVIVSENDIVRAKTALSKKNLVESSSDSDVGETVVEEIIEETVEEDVEETVEKDVEEAVEEDTKTHDEPEFVVKKVEKKVQEERTEIEEEESMLSKYLVLVSEEEDEDEDEEMESTDMFLSLDFMNETDHDEEETSDEMKEDITSFIRKRSGDIPTIEYVSDDDDEEDEDLEYSEMLKEDSPEKGMSRKEEDVFMETLRRKYSVVEEVA